MEWPKPEQQGSDPGIYRHMSEQHRTLRQSVLTQKLWKWQEGPVFREKGLCFIGIYLTSHHL